MRDRFSGLTVTVAIAAAALSAATSVPVTLSVIPASAQGAGKVGVALKTPWGEPDLQGIWTDEFDTALQRPPRYANQEFFTEAQREELDKERSALYGEERPAERGTEFDVARAYNHAVFLSNKHVGARTSLIVDPPDGRIPRLTPEGQKMAAADREFRLALRQLDILRRRSGAKLAAQYRHEREPPFAGWHPPVVWRLPRPLGG